MSSAVLLVSHGSVDDLDDLGAFVTNVRGGQPPSTDLIVELRRRYEAIGGASPLNAITAETARKLEGRIGVRVTWANRLWKPYVRQRLADLCAEGVRQVGLIPLAPYSAHVYAQDARRAAEGLSIDLACAENWGQTADLHAAFASRIVDAIEVPAAREMAMTLVLTAHSLPKTIIDRGDPYEREVRRAADAIGALVEARLCREVRRSVAFQSQGIAKNGGSDHSAEWLGPDLRAAINDAATAGGRIVFAPVGFLADHVEILYDLDLEARRMAAGRGLAYARAASLNAADDLVGVLAQVARPLIHHG
jgi:ferrochelatase